MTRPTDPRSPPEPAVHHDGSAADDIAASSPAKGSLPAVAPPDTADMSVSPAVTPDAAPIRLIKRWRLRSGQ